MTGTIYAVNQLKREEYIFQCVTGHIVIHKLVHINDFKLSYFFTDDRNVSHQDKQMDAIVECLFAWYII